MRTALRPSLIAAAAAALLLAPRPAGAFWFKHKPRLKDAVAASTAAAPGEDPALTRAEAAYESGLKSFRAGDPAEGRADLTKAFALVVSRMDDATLPAALHADFSGMLEKIRGRDEGDDADAPADPAEIPNGLDVPDAELSTAAALGEGPNRMRGEIVIDSTNAITQSFLKIYSRKRPRTVEEALARSGRYKPMISAALKKAGLPPELFYLVMTESEYKIDARSPSGAAGLWQFMPGTARKYGLKVTYWVDERYDPEKATRAAIHYLSDLYAWFGDWNLALAAYNRGEGGLGQDMKWSRSTDFDSLAERNALPQQTHHYVPKFMACVMIGEHPERFGLHPAYDAPDAYDEVPLPRPLDLTVAARCAGVKEEVIHRLNPALRAWATPAKTPGFILRVPKGAKDAFLAKLAEVKDWNPGPVLVRYRVRRGDYLGRIARLHRTTVRAIMELNGLRRARLLRPGMVLKIRPGRLHARR
jgi:membrane-bound lytic murein transglycosylase D